MNEEKVLINRCGNENAFRTPEGYFDALPERVMNRIQHNKQRHRIMRWSVAAVTIGALFAGSLAMFIQHNSSNIAQDTELTFDEAALEYSMINNMEIASYLTEAE